MAYDREVYFSSCEMCASGSCCKEYNYVVIRTSLAKRLQAVVMVGLFGAIVQS